MADLQIGSEVYIYDENYREYKKGKDGRSVGGPIYRAHFRKTKITGETPRQWITHQRKAFKKNPFETGFYTADMVEEMVWSHEHRYRIASLVQHADNDKLRQIAKIIDYNDSKGGQS